jgi:hypothetical protein
VGSYRLIITPEEQESVRKDAVRKDAFKPGSEWTEVAII